MDTKILAKIIADSTSPQGMRITTFLLTYPRIIHSELMTHRVFSRNSASSRAIPFNKMVKMVEEDPFIPIAWQENHSGMQGNKYLNPDTVAYLAANRTWLRARDNAVKEAKELNHERMANVTKQLCNRLLEPFMWHTVLLTGTEFENFFKLRCPQYSISELIDGDDRVFKSKKDLLKELDYDPIFPASDLDWLKINKGQAEIHIQALAESMWDTMNESTPKILQSGEWHIPFGDNIDEKELDKLMPKIQPASLNWYIKQLNILKIKVATARAARLSYMTFDREIDYVEDIKLHDTLLKSGHFSPTEHIARAMSNEEFDLFIKGKLIFRGEEDYDLEEPLFKDKGWCNNFRGWINYRYMIENNYY